MYGRPRKERCCTEKCHARENPFYEGRLLSRGIQLASSLNMSLENCDETPVTVAVRTQFWAEEREKHKQGLIKTPDD